MTPEGKLQLKFKKAVATHGGKSYKFTSPAHRGVSDQVTLTPKGVVFVELKDGNKPLSPLQEVFKRECLAFGMPHEVIRFESNITEFIKKYF